MHLFSNENVANASLFKWKCQTLSRSQSLSCSSSSACSIPWRHHWSVLTFKSTFSLLLVSFEEDPRLARLPLSWPLISSMSVFISVIAESVFAWNTRLPILLSPYQPFQPSQVGGKIMQKCLFTSIRIYFCYQAALHTWQHWMFTNFNLLQDQQPSLDIWPSLVQSFSFSRNLQSTNYIFKLHCKGNNVKSLGKKVFSFTNSYQIYSEKGWCKRCYRISQERRSWVKGQWEQKRLKKGEKKSDRRPQERDEAMRTRQGPEKGIAVGDFSTGLQTAAGLLAAAQGQHKARQGWPKTKSSKKEFRMKGKTWFFQTRQEAGWTWGTST